ncbi:MAG: TlpA disulfide reductase family protein [Planctomycetaceae bacterium]|jgi:thiol-disulfide isomerase/thioredoxin|nr:TlpA disulfide reductase family protein [Planctomycetaceae bacterium]
MFLEKLRDPFHWLSIALIAVIISGSVGWYAFAQDEKPLPPLPDLSAAKDAADPFAIPEDADAKTLAEFIQKLQKIPQQQATSQAQYIALMKKVSEASLKASDLGLKMNDLKAEEKLPFIVSRVRSLVVMGQLGDETKLPEAMKFAATFHNDENAQISSVTKDITQQLKLSLIPGMSEKERQALVDEVLADSEKTGLTRFNLRGVIRLAEAMEQSATGKEAAAVYRRIAKMAATSDNEQIVDYAAKLTGTARRLELPGSQMEVFGKTVAGNDFKWEEYRGKVVLVDFWATWCGPCLQELPNVKANYEKYHDKGFEVVGVNLDQDKQKLMAFTEQNGVPWVNIFPENPESRGWNHPLASYYGISGIPSVILVDQEGTVISTMARGPELGRLLEELLGAPAK